MIQSLPLSIRVLVESQFPLLRADFKSGLLSVDEIVNMSALAVVDAQKKLKLDL